jgi:hypothetical protein
LQVQGQPSVARPLVERALAIAEAVHGPVHATVAGSLSNLTLVLQDLGLADVARPLAERALAITERPPVNLGGPVGRYEIDEAVGPLPAARPRAGGKGSRAEHGERHFLQEGNQCSPFAQVVRLSYRTLRRLGGPTWGGRVEDGGSLLVGRDNLVL